MIKPLALFIGLRYTRAKRRNHFISFIAFASMLGIALGVTVLITVLSVMNGFDEQIRTRFFAMVPEVTILTNRDIAQTWPQLQQQIHNTSGVMASAPYINGEGMILQNGNMRAVSLLGIIPAQESQVSQLAHKMVQGQLTSLQPDAFNVVIGRDLARRLGLKLGDKISILTPQVSTTPLGIMPRFKRFTISGIFHASGGFGFDLGEAFIHFDDAQKLYSNPSQVTSGLNLKITDLYSASRISSQLQDQLPLGYLVTDWTKQYGAFFHALALEKTMLFIILLLIVAVAVFNLISTLVMVVNDKQADIAILRTLGATPLTIMYTFIIQGALIGLIGTLLGLGAGLLLASNITYLANLIQSCLGIHLISSSVFFVNYLPSKIAWQDVLEVCTIACGLSILATIYPALIAFRTQPAEALRYE